MILFLKALGLSLSLAASSPLLLSPTATLLLERHGSQHLSKGHAIILHAPQGKPLYILVGKSNLQDPIWLPELMRSWKELTMTATAYDPGPEANGRGNEGTTFSGERARFGIAAVDPKLIHLKSLLYVEGYGPALAADTGGDIKGRRIDLCFNSTREAQAYGRKKTRVYLLSGLKKAERDKVLDALKN